MPRDSGNERNNIKTMKMALGLLALLILTSCTISGLNNGTPEERRQSIQSMREEVLAAAKKLLELRSRSSTVERPLLGRSIQALSCGARYPLSCHFCASPKKSIIGRSTTRVMTAGFRGFLNRYFFDSTWQTDGGLPWLHQFCFGPITVA